jgi:hypothetical protein
MKTLLFCTSYASTQAGWQGRYKRWLDFFGRSPLQRDQILLIDDGSPVLPAWRGVRMLTELPERQPNDKVVFFHFEKNLGRSAVRVYPGWFRSFAFAAVYARKYGFDKVVHVESDSFVFSERLVRFIDGLQSGWTTFWCPRWGFPETCLQVICADQMESFLELSTIDYDSVLTDLAIETVLPFTDVRKDFIGDRYGEYMSWLPEDADYGCQIPEDWPL